MNRYIIEGIIRDLISGKSVVLVASNLTLSRRIFKALAARDVAWDRVSHANGNERLRLGDGNLRILAATKSAPRGELIDVAVLLDGLRPLDDTARRTDFLEAIKPCDAELIYCE